MNLSVKADVWHNDGDVLKLAGFDIEALHTPGHTEGGTCYYIKISNYCFQVIHYSAVQLEEQTFRVAA